MTTRREFLVLAGSLLAAPLWAQGRAKAGKPPAVDKHPLTPLRGYGKSVILGAPTATSARLNVLVDEPMEAVLRIGARGWSPPFALEAGEPRELRLEGLDAGRVNSWQLVARRPGAKEASWEQAGTVQTARPRGTPFRFAVHADPHNRDEGNLPEIHAETLRATLAEKPDFAIDLGDNFMTEKVGTTAADALQCMRDLRPLYGILGSAVPLFLMNGNHEAELGWMKHSELGEAAHRLRLSHYPYPTPDGFYTGDGHVYTAWHWGDALFVLLDPFWYTERKPGRGGVRDGWGWTLGEQQYRWLETTLRESTARAKFVFCHHLVGGGDECRGGVEFSHLYEWGGRDDDGANRFAGKRPSWGKPIHELLVENRVTIFFHGHDHFYAMQERDGVVYQLAPQPSHRNSRRHLAEEYGYKAGTFLPNSGHLLVDVGAEAVEVAYVRTAGRGAAAGVAHSYRRTLAKG